MTRLAALLVLLAAAAARAQEPDVEDRLATLMAEATAALQAGDYAAALAAFREARTVSDRPVLLFNIGMCHRELGDWGAAVEAFDEYLTQGRETEPAERLAEVGRQRGELAPQLGELWVEVVPAGAELTIDGRSVGSAPLPGPLRLRAGTHVLVARRSGYADIRSEVTTVAGGRTEVTLELTPPDSPRTDPGLESWFWGLLGTTGALGLATAGLGTAMVLYRDDYLLDGRRDAGLYDRTLDLALATNILLGVTAAAAVAAGLLGWFAWAPPGDEEESPNVPELALVPGGLVLTW